jgi:hypothetical protein
MLCIYIENKETYNHLLLKTIFVFNQEFLYNLIFKLLTKTKTKVKQKWLLKTEITSEEILISALPKKCTTQPVLTVMLRLRYLSYPTPKDRFTAGIVFLTTGYPEKIADTKCYLCNWVYINTYFFSTFLNFPLFKTYISRIYFFSWPIISCRLRKNTL